MAVVFGCWTSVSRKSVLPVFEELNGLFLHRCSTKGKRCPQRLLYRRGA
ncbi:transporter substrate-binding protein [Klebsiella pneumoniae subsp. pneumoniae]|nr:transporter substrate-binding protein [Klebsiella pneumoniae subsp. pneumoniae]